jgi:hypothetical protein
MGDDVIKTCATLLMGIDYKKFRRNSAETLNDEPGVIAYSSIQLAEWVIVIEGLDKEDTAIWEVVYDASSNAARPRVHLARFGRTAVAVYPLNLAVGESIELNRGHYPRLQAPSRLTKHLG